MQSVTVEHTFPVTGLSYDILGLNMEICVSTYDQYSFMQDINEFCSGASNAHSIPKKNF